VQGVAGLRPVLPGPEQAASASSHGVRHRVGGKRRTRRVASVSGVEGEENAKRGVREGSEGSREAGA